MMPATPAELHWLNETLPWLRRQAAVSGQMVGAGDLWPEVDDRLLLSGIDFKGKRVLEPACCEGFVTTGLCRLGAEVTAFDARIANVLKTVGRCAVSGFSPHVRLLEAGSINTLGRFDVLVHCGLLYHLPDPAGHLRLCAEVSDIILLDTHVAKPSEALVEAAGYRGHWWSENVSHHFAGLQPWSFWLERTELERCIESIGFSLQVLNDMPDAINGPRMLYLLRKI